jgi:hypothetical protein
MIGVTLARRKYGDLDKFAGEVQTKMSARILNIMANDFSEYVKRTKLSGQVLGVRSGKTRESMGFYQLKRAKSPTYVVRPGRGIDGRLNYLGGMSRGMLITPKRGEFIYIRDDAGNITARVRAATVRARPFMAPAWSEYKSSGNVRAIMTGVYNAYLERAFSGGKTEIVE